MATVKFKLGSKEYQFESKKLYLYTGIIAPVLAIILFFCFSAAKPLTCIISGLITGGVITGIVAINVTAYLKKDDKTNHVYAGMIIAFLAGWFIYYQTPELSVGVSALCGWGVAIFVGFLKEVSDKYIKKTAFGVMDWVATSFGGSIGSILFGVIFWILIISNR